MSSEAVDHPSHYGGDNPYEVIKVLRAWLTPEEYIGALKFNVIKYNARAKHKGSEGQDYAKAAWYQAELDRFVKELGLPVKEQREVLFFASYCGDDNPDCSETKPCPSCLGMSNVFRVRIALSGMTYVRQLAPEWNTQAPPVREDLRPKTTKRLATRPSRSLKG